MPIPDGMTKVQYLVLMMCVIGKGSRMQNPNASKGFQMDENQFEMQIGILRQAGLITSDYKATGDGKRVFEGKASFKDLIAKQKNFQSLLAEQSAAMAAPASALNTPTSGNNPSVTLLHCPSCNAPLDLATESNGSVKCQFCGENVQVHS